LWIRQQLEPEKVRVTLELPCGWTEKGKCCTENRSEVQR
jgi:hypothetical protein